MKETEKLGSTITPWGGPKYLTGNKLDINEIKKGKKINGDIVIENKLTKNIFPSSMCVNEKKKKIPKFTCLLCSSLFFSSFTSMSNDFTGLFNKMLYGLARTWSVHTSWSLQNMSEITFWIANSNDL